MSVQVSLAPSALAADGSGVAAAITAPGGNKAKVKDGEAVFKNVRIEADSPGAYTLRVKSASRKVGCNFHISYWTDVSHADECFPFDAWERCPCSWDFCR